MDFEKAKFNMVEQLIRPWNVLNTQLLDKFMEINRHDFVSTDQQTLAYSDTELSLSHGQKMLNPKVEAKLLQALDPQAEHTALEIGTGSGFVTALLAASVKSVVTVEYHQDLLDQAKKNLEAYKFDNVIFEQGDASKDWPDGKTYNLIFISGALPEITEAYKNKLAIGGKLVVVEGKTPDMKAKLITHLDQKLWKEEMLFETELAYLINTHPSANFEF